MAEQYTLNWYTFTEHLQMVLKDLYEEERYCDEPWSVMTKLSSKLTRLFSELAVQFLRRSLTTILVNIL